MLLPTDDTQIIVVCFTSQTANKVSAILNLLGYNAWAMRYGMMGWKAETKQVKIGFAKQIDQTILGAGFEVVTY